MDSLSLGAEGSALALSGPVRYVTFRCYGLCGHLEVGGHGPLEVVGLAGLCPGCLTPLHTI